MFYVTAQQPGQTSLRDIGPVLPVIVSGPSGQVRTLAAVDTGSEVSSADRGLLDQIGARQVGTILIQSVMGAQVVPIYAADLLTDAGFTLTGGLPGILGDTLPPPIQALIGRDVLRQMVLHYDGLQGAWYLASYAPVPETGPAPGLRVAAALGTGLGVAILLGEWLEGRRQNRGRK